MRGILGNSYWELKIARCKGRNRPRQQHAQLGDVGGRCFTAAMPRDKARNSQNYGQVQSN